MTRQDTIDRILAALPRLDDAALSALADMAEHPETIPVPRHVAKARAKALARDVIQQARRVFAGER